MPLEFRLLKADLCQPPWGTSDWLHGYKPGKFFLIYTKPQADRVNDYPHFNIPLKGAFTTSLSGHFQIPMYEYHYSLADGDRRYREFRNGLWTSPNPWEADAKNADIWDKCKKFEALLQRVINPTS